MFCDGILVADSGGGGEAAMFLKRLERRKDGKRHTYWALVESVRTAGTSRHRVVAYLGALGPREQSGWATLARRLSASARMTILRIMPESSTTSARIFMVGPLCSDPSQRACRRVPLAPSLYMLSFIGPYRSSRDMHV